VNGRQIGELELESSSMRMFFNLVRSAAHDDASSSHHADAVLHHDAAAFLGAVAEGTLPTPA
jgi:hypothetical protein